MNRVGLAAPSLRYGVDFLLHSVFIPQLLLMERESAKRENRRPLGLVDVMGQRP